MAIDLLNRTDADALTRFTDTARPTPLPVLNQDEEDEDLEDEDMHEDDDAYADEDDENDDTVDEEGE